MNVSKAAFIFGLISIPLSIALWFIAPDLSGAELTAIADPALRSAFASAQAERWGIFVGLWAPTLIAISIASRLKP